MGVCKPEHINGTLAGLMAQALDKKDGKVDKQINAKEWNIFIDGIREKTGNDKLGKKINNSISLENAIKSITTYACKNATADKNGTAVAREWVKDLGLEINIKKAPAAPVEETPEAPAEETPAAPVEETPEAPAEETPAAPVEETPAAPAEETPAAPAEETPAAPVEETPAAQAEETTAEPVEETPAEDVQEFSQPSPYVSLEEHPEYASSPSESYPDSDRFLQREVDETKTKTRKRLFGLLGEKTTKYDKDGKKIFVEKKSRSGAKRYKYFDKDGKKTHIVQFNAEGKFSWWINWFDKWNANTGAGFYEDGKIKSLSEYNSNDEEIRETNYSVTGRVYKIKEYNHEAGTSKVTEYDNGTISITEYNGDKPVKQTKRGGIDCVTEYTDGRKVKETKDWGNEYIEVSDYDVSTGNKVKTTFHNLNGGISVYDNNPSTEKLEKKTNIRADGSIETVEEYNNNGDCTKIASYNTDNKLISYILYTYDENENSLKDAYYNSDSELESYVLYTYDDNGYHTKSTYCNSDDSVKYYEVNGDNKTIIYNAKDEKVGTVSWGSGKYYDNDGNEVESVDDLLK